MTIVAVICTFFIVTVAVSYAEETTTTCPTGTLDNMDQFKNMVCAAKTQQEAQEKAKRENDANTAVNGANMRADMARLVEKYGWMYPGWGCNCCNDNSCSSSSSSSSCECCKCCGCNCDSDEYPYQYEYCYGPCRTKVKQAYPNYYY